MAARTSSTSADRLPLRSTWAASATSACADDPFIAKSSPDDPNSGLVHPINLPSGATARAVTTQLRHDPQEMAEVRWVTRQEYAALLRAGAIRVPGGISIAKRIIERWLGDTVETVAGRPLVAGWRPS